MTHMPTIRDEDWRYADAQALVGLTPADLGAAAELGLVLRKLYAPSKQKAGTLLAGTPAEQATQLLAKLREAKVL